jgi:predicted Na+-dependent transporter
MEVGFMIKIKDKFVFGAIAGMIANIFETIFTYIFYLLDINDYTSWQTAASSFVNKARLDHLSSVLIGAIVDFSIAASLGVVILYLLYYTKKGYSIFKGIAVGLFYYTVIYGTVMSLEITNINPNSPTENLIDLFSHILLGSITAFIITKFGEDLI